jgi:nucleoside 2-deoxyribosyltransferase
LEFDVRLERKIMTEGKAQTCPVCKLNDDQIVSENAGDFGRFHRINCPRCKGFTITNIAQSTLPGLDIGPKLSAWIRNRNEQYAEVPQITTDTIKDLQAGFPDYGPREKQIILLQNIVRNTEYPGKPVKIVPKYDIPLAWASSQEEFMYYIISLIDRNLLRNIGRGEKVHWNLYNELIYDSSGFSVAITPDGWNYLEQHERHIEERTQAFVAMSFSEDLKPIWEGPIYNAITKAGYKPYRVDAEPHIDRIDFKIISEIKNSRFLIADVTEHKLGVYFEAGYALGLGLPVIWSVRKDYLHKVHFDTRQYNHIVWEESEDLEKNLYDFICVIIGKGKEA